KGRPTRHTTFDGIDLDVKASVRCGEEIQPIRQKEPVDLSKALARRERIPFGSGTGGQSQATDKHGCAGKKWRRQERFHHPGNVARTAQTCRVSAHRARAEPVAKVRLGPPRYRDLVFVVDSSFAL